MKKKYKRNAYLLDEDVLIHGYKDKYGFHPNKTVPCGFTLQKFNKHSIGKDIFFSLEDAMLSLKEIHLVGSEIRVAIDRGFEITKIFLLLDGSVFKYIKFQTKEEKRNIEQIIEQYLQEYNIVSIRSSNIDIRIM